MIFSHDSKLLATTVVRGTILVWEAKTGIQKHKIEGGSSVTKLQFSHDSSLLAVCYELYSELWETNTGSLKKKFPQSEGVGSAYCTAFFSPNMEMLISPKVDGTIEIWDISTGSLRQNLRPRGGVSMGVFSNDSKLLVLGCSSGALHIWNVASSSLERIIERQANRIHFMKFTHDSRILISSSRDGLIEVWDTVTWSVISTLDARSSEWFSPYSMTKSFSNDCKLLAFAIKTQGEPIRIWDMARLSHESGPNGGSRLSYTLEFSEDLKQLISESLLKTEELLINVRNTSTGSIEQRFELDCSKKRLVALSRDWRLFARTSDDDDITEIVESDSGVIKQPLMYPGSDTESGNFSNDSNLLALFSYEGDQTTINIWSTVTGQLLRKFVNDYSFTEYAGFSNDSRYFAAVYRVEIKIFRFLTKMRRPEPHRSQGSSGRLGVHAWSSRFLPRLETLGYGTAS